MISRLEAAQIRGQMPAISADRISALLARASRSALIPGRGVEVSDNFACDLERMLVVFSQMVTGYASRRRLAPRRLRSRQ